MGFFKEDTDLQFINKLSKGKKPKKSLQEHGRDIVRKIRREDAQSARMQKAVKVGVQATRISDLALKHVQNAEKNFDRGMNNIIQKASTGQTQKPAQGANQNNPPKNVRYMGNSAGGYKLGDPRTSSDTYERFIKKEVSKHEKSFNAVHQLRKKLVDPNTKNYREVRDAAQKNKDVPKPKTANTNYTKKAVTAIKTMGKIARGSSIIGALSYAAASTPVGDATIHKGFNQKEFKRK
jgi:hypothetical protein